MSRHGSKSPFFRELDELVRVAQLEAMAAKANEVIERDTCKNCGALVVGHIAAAGLVIEYAGYKFCSELCLNNWVDEQMDNVPE